jgi:hypothetical protein
MRDKAADLGAKIGMEEGVAAAIKVLEQSMQSA